jgi:hypothetical protein
MKTDLYKLCLDVGMTQEEFQIELVRSYATYISTLFDQNPDATGFKYTADFGDHSIVIESRCEPCSIKPTIN